MKRDALKRSHENFTTDQKPELELLSQQTLPLLCDIAISADSSGSIAQLAVDQTLFDIPAGWILPTKEKILTETKSQYSIL